MDFYTALEISQLRAIHAALEPSAESIWRMKCRQYSEKFYTPLHVVMNQLDPMLVLQALYETQYPPSVIEEELDDILERLYSIKDPEYSAMSKEQVEDLVDAVMNKEIKRTSKVKAPTQQTITSEIKAAEVKKLTTPKSGGMDFGSLEKLEAASETNKAGFEPQ